MPDAVLDLGMDWPATGLVMAQLKKGLEKVPQEVLTALFLTPRKSAVGSDF